MRILVLQCFVILPHLLRLECARTVITLETRQVDLVLLLGLICVTFDTLIKILEIIETWKVCIV